MKHKRVEAAQVLLELSSMIRCSMKFIRLGIALMDTKYRTLKYHREALTNRDIMAACVELRERLNVLDEYLNVKKMSLNPMCQLTY